MPLQPQDPIEPTMAQPLPPPEAIADPVPAPSPAPAIGSVVAAAAAPAAAAAAPATENPSAPAAVAATGNTAVPLRERCRTVAGCREYRTHAWPATPQQRQFCAIHAEPGMVDTGKRLCRCPGCSKEAARGDTAAAGGDNRSGTGLCAQHAAEAAPAMPSQLPRNKCKWPAEECKVRPFYGIPGSRNPEFCARHSYDGMVDLRDASRSKSRSGRKKAGGKAGGSSGKKNAADGAGAGPSAGAGAAVVGGADGGSNEAAVAQPFRSGTGGRRSCSYPDCRTRPTYGWKGNTARECCSKHAHAEMVDVSTKRCVWFCLLWCTVFLLAGAALPAFFDRQFRLLLVKQARLPPRDQALSAT